MGRMIGLPRVAVRRTANDTGHDGADGEPGWHYLRSLDLDANIDALGEKSTARQIGEAAHPSNYNPVWTLGAVRAHFSFILKHLVSLGTLFFSLSSLPPLFVNAVILINLSTSCRLDSRSTEPSWIRAYSSATTELTSSSSLSRIPFNLLYVKQNL